MDTELNIFTKTKTSRVHTRYSLPQSLHQIISLAQPNDMKIIIVQECRGLSWNLQTFYSTGEDKVKWALC